MTPEAYQAITKPKQVSPRTVLCHTITHIAQQGADGLPDIAAILMSIIVNETSIKYYLSLIIGKLTNLQCEFDKLVLDNISPDL